MNLVWHIVKKDLRRLWLPLALWALLVVAQVGVGLNLLLGNGTTDEILFDRMAVCNYLFLFLDLVFAYVLVAALLHDDSLIGTDVFWRTRPISGGRLLGAKLMGAAIMFGALPVLIWLPWWLTCNYGWREVAGAVPEILFTHGIAVAAALLVAVLTDSLGRFLGWSIMLAITLATLALAALSSTQAATKQYFGGLLETRIILAFAVLMLAIAVVVVRQFLARRADWAFGFAVAGFGLATGICTLWPWDVSVLWAVEPTPIKSAQPPTFAEGVTIAFDQARLRLAPSEEKFPSRLAVGFKVTGIPEGFELYGHISRQTWRWTRGESVRGDPQRFNMVGSAEKVLGLPVRRQDFDFMELVARQFQRNGEDSRLSPYSEIKLSTQGSDELIGIFGLLRPEALRINSEPPAYTVEAQFRLFRPEVEIELPLAPGDRHWLGRTSLRVVQGRQREGRFDESMVESRPTSWIDGFHGITPFAHGTRLDEDYYATSPWVGYHLVNRERGNMTGLGITNAYLGGPIVRIGTVEFRWVRMWFGVPRQVGREITEGWDWFEHATLIKTTVREITHFSREIKVDRFEVKP